MITLSFSGHAEGLAASSNIRMFSIKDGSITQLIEHALSAHGNIDLPFEVLSIFVEAMPHGPASRSGRGAPITVSAISGLLKFHTGQAQKAYVLKLQGECFYALDDRSKRVAIADAFHSVATKIGKDFPGDAGDQLANIIASCADRYRGDPDGLP